jgi:hypothetical protein
MNKYLLAAIAALIAFPALAGDVNPPATKAPSYQYPTTKCGMYYGVDAGGSSGAVANTAAGTNMDQGYAGLTVGYTCPTGTLGFWYVDGDFDFHNINGGNTAGVSLFSGPVFLRQRFGFGIPFNQIIAAIPGLASLQNALPALNPLPAGQTVVTSNPSIYLATTWDDVGAKLGLQNFQAIEFGLDVGLSVKVRISNGIVMEPYAEYLIPSTAKCIGVSVVGGCIKETSRLMIGTKTLF